MIISWKYLAGFFEGDGSCGCYPIKFKKKTKTVRYKFRKSKNNYTYMRITFSLHNSDLSLLKRIRKFIGFGYVGKHNGLRLGKKQMYMYMTHCSQALKILTKIHPFVVGNYKLNQLERAINKYETAKKGVV